MIAGIILLVVGAILVTVGLGVGRSSRRVPVSRVAVGGYIVRQASFGRAASYEFTYPLPDGTWVRAMAPGPVSPTATLGWGEGTKVRVLVSTANPRDAVLRADGSLNGGRVVSIALSIIGSILGVIGLLLLLLTLATGTPG